MPISVLVLYSKRAYNKWEQMSSEILHVLKVKLPLQNDQRWLSLLSWFSKFSGKVRYATQVNTHTSGSTSLICDLLAQDLLYPLSVKYRAVICSLFLLEFQ